MKSLVKIWDKLPNVKLFENTPDNIINTEQLLVGKRVVIFGVPGAFTPGCSKTHLPGYVQDFEKYKNKGIDIIACVSVNDPFVMQAWGEAHNVGDKIRMLADTHGDLSRELGVVLDSEPFFGHKRMKRFSMVVNDGTVEQFNVEAGGTGLTCSLSEGILNMI